MQINTFHCVHIEKEDSKITIDNENISQKRLASTDYAFCRLRILSSTAQCRLFLHIVYYDFVCQQISDKRY